MILDINRKLFAHSDRVKAVDFHPTEPWLLAGLYSGGVNIWNYETGQLLKTFEVAEVPVRCCKFIARNNWFVAGSDDFHLRCFNYNTHDKVANFEAHPDYIRCMAVHPTAPYVLTGSDDMTVRLWDFDNNWRLVQTFEGNAHYIMNIAFNPKDSNTFATSCLDKTVRIWTLGSSQANYVLEAHDKGVNYVEYYHGGEKPYLLTCGDDRTIKIWDYISRSCVQTLSAHSSNVSYAMFHPSLPLIISGSEDGTVKLWNSNTYRLETTLDYGLERCWCVAYRRKGNDVGFGFDRGAVVVKIGKEEPSVSMDASGKVIWAKGAEVLTTNVGAVEAETLADGQRVAISTREMGTTEVFPQLLQHSPNGRFVTVCGDGEYIIYTALAWRNKAFGAGTGFAWSHDSNTYAVREASGTVKVFRNFKERVGLVNPGFKVEDVKGGALLGIMGQGFVCFFDWDSGALVRRIDVEAKDLFWSGTNELVAITSDTSFYILRFDQAAYSAALESGVTIDDEGIEDAFDVVVEISEAVRTAKWTGECFIYTNSNNRIQYLIGEQTHTINHTDSELYLLGFLQNHGRVYLVDKDMTVYSYALSLAVLEYQTAILRKDFEEAAQILQRVPAEQRNKIARFLEAQDQKQLALEVSTDPDHKFDLAVALEDFDTALDIAREGPKAGSEPRWRTLGDKALQRFNPVLAQECFEKAGDLSALLLLGTSTGDRGLLQRIGLQATEKGLTNIAFAAYLSCGDSAGCIDVLVAADRVQEAAIFARTYAPSRASELVRKWKAQLNSSKRPKQRAIAQSLADPALNPDAFEEGWGEALAKEREMEGANPTTRARLAEHEPPVKVVPNEGVGFTTTNGVKSVNGVGTNGASGNDLMS